RQQAIAQHALRALQRSALLELRMMRNEYFFDPVGLIDQEEMLRTGPEVNDVAELANGGGHESNRVPPKCEQLPARYHTLRSGRKCLVHDLALSLRTEQRAKRVEPRVCAVKEIGRELTIAQH